MATLAQIHANRANSAKSTGPKTAEGKNAARRNALTHGLAAEKLLLPDGEAEVIAARIVEWTPCLLPKDADAYDAWLVEEMVVSSVRIDRCHAHESALRSRQATRATLCWDLDREADAEELGATLAKAPARVSRKLQRTKQGCAWMIGRWEGLGHIWEGKGDWDEAQKRLALDLLGTPKELRDGPTPLDGDRPALIRAQVQRLATLAAEALDALDEQERSDAEIGLGPDTDKALALARRYEAAIVRRMNWAQAQLNKKGRQVSAAGPRAPEPEPEPEPESAAVAEARADAEMDRLLAILERPAPPPFPFPLPPAPAPAFVSPSPRPHNTTGENRKARRARKAHARKS